MPSKIKPGRTGHFLNIGVGTHGTGHQPTLLLVLEVLFRPEPALERVQARTTEIQDFHERSMARPLRLRCLPLQCPYARQHVRQPQHPRERLGIGHLAAGAPAHQFVRCGAEYFKEFAGIELLLAQR